LTTVGLTTVVYRIGFAKTSTTTDHAIGSTLSAGRWHTLSPRPRRVIYAASSRALAQLEKRVHANGVAPTGQALFAMHFPPSLKIESAMNLGLSSNWRADETISQTFGDAWLDQCTDLALWIPSYVEPAENNILINPDHRDLSKIKLVIERNPFEFDPRLV
jgi:RES domain-containing protein